MGGAKVRVDIKALLRNPKTRKELAIRFIMAAQAMEGIETTRAQAEAAYERVQGEKLQAVRAAKRSRPRRT